MRRATVRGITWGAALALALSSPGCANDATLLLVDLRTDLVAGAEFDRVRVEASPSTGAPRVVDTLVDPYSDYTRVAVRVAEIEGMATGPVSIDVRLLQGPAEEVVQRTVRVDLLNQVGVTVIITRDCRDVTCPAPGGDPAAVTCLGGECVDPGCTPETPEHCPTPQCTNDTECPPPEAPCARALCVTGACLSAPDPLACGADAYCDPQEGCVSRPATDAGTPDAGPTDTSPPDAGPDVGPPDSGPPDSGVSGITIPALPYPQVVLKGAARRSDGKVVVVGSVGTDNRFDGLLLRLGADGALDTSFGPGGLVVHDFGSDNDRFNALALLPDEGIVVAGESTPTTPTDVDATLARFNADGAIDSDFGAGALVLAHGTWGTRRDRATALIADAMGRVTVVGEADRSRGGREDFFAYRLLDDATPDPSFGSGGWVDILRSQNSYATFAAATEAGGVWFGGPCHTFTCLLRLDTTGALDPTFATDGITVADYYRDLHRGRAVATAPDGSVVVVGDIGDRAGPRDILVLRYLPDGTTDPAFGVDGAIIITTGDAASASCVLLEPDGHIMVGGRARWGDRYDALLARLNPDGSPDVGFGDAGISRQTFDPGGSEVRALFALGGGGVGVLAQAGHRVLYATAALGDATLPVVEWLVRLPFNPVETPEAVPEEVILLDGETVDGETYSHTSPLTAHRVEIQGAVGPRAGRPTAIFIRAGEVIFQTGAILATNGSPGLPPRAGIPGAGGEGGSGGGSGAVGHSAYAGYGGNLGGDGLGVFGAAGGRGWGAVYTGDTFWGWGGHGGIGSGCCPPLVSGGEGGNGAGGGGGGTWTNVLTSGAGGGGGLLVIVADRIGGSGIVEARGAGGGWGTGGGGGGVVWLAARSYDGSLTADVSGGSSGGSGEAGWPGTARILRIMPDGTLRERAFSDSW